MRIVDLDYAITQYNNENNIDHNIHNNKYLLLALGNEIYSLKILDVSKEAIYLKPIEEGNK